MAVPTLTETVEKVDRAVARLEELQCTIKSTNLRQSGGRGEAALRSQQKVGSSGREADGQESRRRRGGAAALGGGRGGRRPEDRENRGEWRRWSAPARVVHRATAGIVDASLSLPQDSGKENAGCALKKPRRKVAKNKVCAQAGGEITDSPPEITTRRRSSQRHVLATRAPNVAPPPPPLVLPVSHSSSPSAWSCSSGESKRVHVANSSSESVGPAAALQREDTDSARSAAKLATPHREARPLTRRSSRSAAPASGRAPPLSAAPRRLRLSAATSTAAPPLKSPSSCSSSPPTRSTAPAPPRSSLPKTFCVHVRSDPNRPWRLSSSSASTDIKSPRPSRPLLMFPNPTFAPSSSAPANPLPSAKLSPFNSFQLKPLSIPHQQDSTNTPPATVRPYLSPSRVSPKQQSGSCNRSSTRHSSSTVSIAEVGLQSPGNKPEQKGRQNINARTKNWLSRRSSLPISQPSKAIRRCSIFGKQEGSPLRPLPSLITRLPTRRKPRRSIDSPLQQTTVTPSSRPSRAAQLAADRRADAATNPRTPASPRPLPLPPALRLDGFKANAHVRGNAVQKPEPQPTHKRSLSCPRRELGPLDGNSSLQQEEEDKLARLQAGSMGKENFNRQAGEKERRKILAGLDCGAFPGCSSSVWPAMRRSWSFSHECSFDSMSKCTGAGPCLVKHMKGWMHSKKTMSSQVYRSDSYKQASRAHEDKPYFA